MKQASQYRQRLIDRFNASVRYPRMWGDLQAETDIGDLAYVDEVEDELESFGRDLRDRGWWSETRFRGAVELAFGDIACGATIAHAPLVETGLRFRWLALDRALGQTVQRHVVTHAPAWLSEQPRSPESLVATFGSPSIRVSNGDEQSVGFGCDDATVPIVWFDVAGQVIVSLRCAGDTIVSEFLFGQPPTFDAEAATKSVNLRKHSPSPFRQSGQV